ncbi:MAG: 4-amino-4-deoxy-L-arabinose-phosphoundecaprenol flippase subunit ArnF [Euryarchaeota archaeon ADurb.Bin165]|nr:MAG: 4-amino-4-deoxy-L-arabinose-phosphoundecaprenol flippase subunit ArnF [Euryarchaeota archaeon ADurb.Bin165]
MKSIRNFSYIILAIFFQSIGGIYGKFAAITLSDITLFAVITNTFYIASLACLFFQAVVWQQALMHYPLSFAYPFMSLVNFVILLSSAVLFDEGITITNIAGLVLISVGITVLSRERGRSKIPGDTPS